MEEGTEESMNVSRIKLLSRQFVNFPISLFGKKFKRAIYGPMIYKALM
jgi:hypothetical protein